MKIFLQTEILNAESAASEPRPRVALLETATGGPAVRAALLAIAERLGAIAAIPPAAHESNLKQVVLRDLAAHGVLPGTAPEDDRGEAVLKVLRTPKGDAPAAQGEVFALRYEVLGG